MHEGCTSLRGVKVCGGGAGCVGVHGSTGCGEFAGAAARGGAQRGWVGVRGPAWRCLWGVTLRKGVGDEALRWAAAGGSGHTVVSAAGQKVGAQGLRRHVEGRVELRRGAWPCMARRSAD